MSHFNRPLHQLIHRVSDINYGRELPSLEGLLLSGLNMGETVFEDGQGWALCVRCHGLGIIRENWAIDDQYYINPTGERNILFTIPTGQRGCRCFACPGKHQDGFYVGGRFELPDVMHHKQALMSGVLTMLGDERVDEVYKIARTEISTAESDRWGYQEELRKFWAAVGMRLDRRASGGLFISKDDMQVPYIRRAAITVHRTTAVEPEVYVMVKNGWEMETAKFFVRLFKKMAAKSSEGEAK